MANRAIHVLYVLPDCVTEIVRGMSNSEVLHLIEHGLEHEVALAPVPGVIHEPPQSKQ